MTAAIAAARRTTAVMMATSRTTAAEFKVRTLSTGAVAAVMVHRWLWLLRLLLAGGGVEKSIARKKRNRRQMSGRRRTGARSSSSMDMTLGCWVSFPVLSTRMSSRLMRLMMRFLWLRLPVL
jgi:hypothetical protein